MKRFLFLILSAFLLAASACSVVTVTEPIGEKPVRIKPEQWEGLWKLYSYSSPFSHGDVEDYLLIEVSDGENGVLKVQDIGRESRSVKVYLRESNGWMFGSYRNPTDAAEEKGMIWGKFIKDGNHIYFWNPNYGRFSDLVNKGLLPGHPYAGESDDGDLLVLSDLKAEHMKLITSDSKVVLFDWEFPFFMVRLSDDIN